MTPFQMLDKPALRDLIGNSTGSLTYVDDTPQNPPTPRVTFMYVTAEPNLYYADPSDQDREILQIDVYATSWVETRAILRVIRQLMQYNGIEQAQRFDFERETRLSRASIDYILFTPTGFRRA